MFPPTSILIHIGCKEACRSYYGARFDQMKKEKAKVKKQRSRKNIGTEKELESQRKSYAENLKRRSYRVTRKEWLLKKPSFNKDQSMYS